MTAAFHNKDESMRIAAVSNVHHVITFMFYKSANFTNMSFNITGEKTNLYNHTSTSTVAFNVTANPSSNLTYVSVTKASAKLTKPVLDDKDEVMDLTELIVSKDLRKPKTEFKSVKLNYKTIKIINETALAQDIRDKIIELDYELTHDMLTDAGYHKKLFDLVKSFPNSYLIVAERETKHLQLENATDHIKGDMFDIVTKQHVRSIAQLRYKIRCYTKNIFQFTSLLKY